MRASVFATAALCLAVVPLAAQEKSVGAQAAALIAPLGGAEALAVVRIDAARLDLPAAADWVADAIKAPPEERTRIREMMVEPQWHLQSFRKAGGKELFLVLLPATSESGREPVELAGVATVAAGKGDQVADVVGALLPPSHHFELQIKGENVYFALPHRIKALDAAARPSAAVAKALDASGGGAIQAALLLPEDYRRVVRETFPRLPDELGGATGKELADWFQWGSLSVNLPPEPKLVLQVQASSPAAARSLQELVASAYKAADPPPEVRQALGDFEKLVAMLTPKAQGDKLVLQIATREEVDRVVPAIGTAVQRARAAAARSQHMNSLKQIGLALHNFHDVNRGFPAHSTYGKDGKKLLSWRVQILPYIEQEALYREFRHDEPWDSEHNKKLIERMPDLYQDPRVDLKEPGRTTFVVPIGEKTIFGEKEGTKIQKITDGTSNTILAVQSDAQHAVIWTKPEDLEIDPKDPARGLFVDDRGTVTLLFADGSVRVLQLPKEKEKLPPLYTASGGEVVPQ